MEELNNFKENNYLDEKSRWGVSDLGISSLRSTLKSIDGFDRLKAKDHLEKFINILVRVTEENMKNKSKNFEPNPTCPAINFPHLKIFIVTILFTDGSIETYTMRAESKNEIFDNFVDMKKQKNCFYEIKRRFSDAVDCFNVDTVYRLTVVGELKNDE
jgi:hypothetical protein